MRLRPKTPPHFDDVGSASDREARPTFIHKGEIKCDLGVSDATLWRWIRHGHFPASIQIGPGPNSRAWLRADFEAWKRRVTGGGR